MGRTYRGWTIEPETSLAGMSGWICAHREYGGPGDDRICTVVGREAPSFEEVACQIDEQIESCRDTWGMDAGEECTCSSCGLEQDAQSADGWWECSGCGAGHKAEIVSERAR